MKPTLTYICKDSGKKFSSLSIERDTFVGFEIKKYNGRVSTIVELDGEGVSTVINFRGTSTPIIDTITCSNGYTQERYSNNTIRTEYRVNHKQVKHGEFLFYSPDGFMCNRNFFSPKNVTSDVIQMIGYKGNTVDFFAYQFGSDEMFNLSARYGLDFQFYEEYKHSNARFNEIAEFCIHH